MSELRLVGNLIEWTAPLGLNYGHFQIVFVDGATQSEIEIDQGPGLSLPFGNWEYHGPQEHTPDIFHPENYAYATIDLGDRSAKSVWELLVDIHEQFETNGTGISYEPLDQNSNYYLNTLLEAIGLDDPTIVALSSRATPEAVDAFPAFGVNVLEDPGDAISLNLNGTDEGDIVHTGLGNDILSGLGGNDRLAGGGGDDRLDGGAGNDVLNGGPGDDFMVGGPDQDTFEFSEGYNFIDDFNYDEDSIFFPEGTTGELISENEATLLTYPGGSLTLYNFVLSSWVDPNQIPGLTWIPPEIPPDIA
jgi:hypothetical protein